MKKKYVIIALSLIVIALIIAFGQVFTVRSIDVVFENKSGLSNEGDILSASGISDNKNIFNVKESDIKKNVSSHFDDNSIVVTNVVREFPNKIVIHVKERMPIFLIKVYSAEGEDRYVATDKDFQRGKIQKKEDIDIRLVEVVGYEVYDSFNVIECIALRNMVKGFISQGIQEEAIPYFLDTVRIENEQLCITLFDGAEMYVGFDHVQDDIAVMYNNYLSTEVSSRKNAVFGTKI